jgi:hypothetical protein
LCVLIVSIVFLFLCCNNTLDRLDVLNIVCFQTVQVVLVFVLSRPHPDPLRQEKHCRHRGERCVTKN